MTTQGSFKRRLGSRTDIQVPAIGTGLWAVSDSAWGPSDDNATLAAIDEALDAGADFFDTADVYGGGQSERLLGQAMKGRRDRFVVATKIGWLGFDEQKKCSQYNTVEKLIAGVDESLRRLQTDHVEIIQCHISYAEAYTPVFIDGFRKLKEQGKVKAWGVSTGEFDHLKRFDRDGDCDVLQIDYSILNREPEKEILPYCHDNGIGVIVRGPLAMGLLADKFSSKATFPGNDFRHKWIEDAEQNTQFKRDLQTVQQLRAAIPQGWTMAQLALSFVAHSLGVSTVIPGARNPHQARMNCAVNRLPPLNAEQLALINRIVPPGAGRKIWPA